MEEQFRQWRIKAISEYAKAYSSGGAGHMDSHMLADMESRLTYADFKASVMQGDDGGQLLNYVNSNVIFQAGVDFESKPMVVFCSCNLPKEVDLDRLLNLIIFRLDEFVESDYTVVMFTSGAQYNPGWHWLSKAYRRLDRKYRKNVKNVYVVHPSMWSKLIFQIFGKIVSPKFFAKVTWVDTLSQLAGLVPLNQINVPQPVYEHNMKVESAMSASSQAKSSRNRATTHSQPAEQPASLESQVFGVPLETLVTNATAGMLPRPLRECISYIRHNGLATEGLFRRSPPSTALRAAKDSYNRGQHVDLDLAGVHVAAVLLKLFFRELPTPVFGTQNSYEIVRALPLAGKTAPQEEGDTVDAVSEQMDNVRARYVEEVVLGSLDKACRLVLCFTFALLGVVSRHEEDNRMSAYNLAIVWAPNLARSDNPVEDVSMCAGGGATVGAVVQIMVRFFDRVFVREIEEILGKQPEDAAVAILDAVDQMNTGPVAPELPKRRPIAGSAETEAFSDDGSEQPFADAETAVVEEHPLDTGDNDDDGKAAAESTSQTTKSSD